MSLCIIMLIDPRRFLPSMIKSNYIIIHNIMPYCLAGKRPRSAMSPLVFINSSGSPVFSTGASGGDKIIPALISVCSHTHKFPIIFSSLSFVPFPPFTKGNRMDFFPSSFWTNFFNDVMKLIPLFFFLSFCIQTTWRALYRDSDLKTAIDFPRFMPVDSPSQVLLYEYGLPEFVLNELRRRGHKMRRLDNTTLQNSAIGHVNSVCRTKRGGIILGNADYRKQGDSAGF